MQTQNNQIIFLIIIVTVFILLLLGFIMAILFLYQRRQIAFQKQMEETKLNHEKNLLQTQLEIQEQTFQNISREIHDNIGLSLTLAKLRLNTLNYHNQSKTTEDVASSVDLISKAITDLSDISKGLNSEAIQTHGLYNALQAETEKIRRSGRYEVEFIVEGTTVFLEAQKELVLYRIAQEALNNILKHSLANCIRLKLFYEPTQLTMQISDDGNGFDMAHIEDRRPSKMMAGLVNMRIRAGMINGICTIESSPGKGTTVCVTVIY